MAWESIDNKQDLAHLGITATHVRSIKSGAEYEQYFGAATGKTEEISDNATVHDTLDFVGVLVYKTINDTKKIAQVLKRATLDATCKSIFDFFYQNYQYKLDEYGVEQVRRPTRAFADRKTGIDCDCFTASVSSVLTNLGIEHYLKIIAINGKPEFQHIYVVVPKRQGLDINSRANYWVIDPVLNNYDEEAPKITQTKHLKMNGIPLQQLNGIEDSVAGLGNEFDGIEEELNGLDEESIGRVFHNRLKQHVINTRKKIESNPQSVSRFYKPAVLLQQVKTLETAMDGTEEHLMSVLEGLSATEHEAVHEQYRGIYDALHGHDSHLYGAMFGDIDDKMLDGVSGLGRRGGSSRSGRSAAKTKSGNKGKRGFFTKIKNAKKLVKSGKVKGKLKAAIKKVGKFIKKSNPVSIAARAGFIVAMRTNFGMLAEKIYWALNTVEFAKSKGIPVDYYNACVQLFDKMKKVFVGKLAGDEGALRKAVLNGRAAKKIAKMLKKRGMSGSTEELFGLGGLGVVAEASVTAAIAFLTPLIALSNKLFKGKNTGKIKNEKGEENDSASENAEEEMDNTAAEASSPSDTTVDNDGSIEAADAENDADPEADSEYSEKKKTGRTSAQRVKPSTPSSATKPMVQNMNNGKPVDENGNPEPETSGKNGLMIGSVIGLAALALLAVSKSDKKRAATEGANGLGNFSAKRESKNLKTKLTKQGVKMPHGYSVEKRKTKKVKTIKI